ncbi:hypothetical protein C6I21_15120 [Alkalicoccus urumqiensis]|uniref:Uncharacterized protein n=1 Tax=Alkalicoccus urumqiensis TaxID=1548213 RepID=A0A2P6MDH4_ALKUR|nr:hypothetical protein C6I21_15120 [Alkalicoccus urumqiensis]
MECRLEKLAGYPFTIRSTASRGHALNQRPAPLPKRGAVRKQRAAGVWRPVVLVVIRNRKTACGEAPASACRSMEKLDFTGALREYWVEKLEYRREK